MMTSICILFIAGAFAADLNWSAFRHTLGESERKATERLWTRLESIDVKRDAHVEQPGWPGARTLVVAFNSVHRANADYLTETVTSIIDQAESFKSDYFDGVRLLVMSQDKKDSHPAFQNLAPSPFLMSVDNSDNRVIDPHADDQKPVDDKNNRELRPGKRVRQQSIDLVSLLDRLIVLRPSHAVITEDDATLCPNGLARIARNIETIEKTHRGYWSMMRTSIGFIGIVVPYERFVQLKWFLQRYYMIKPPDLLLSEYQHGMWSGSARVTEYDDPMLSTSPVPVFFDEFDKDAVPRVPDEPQTMYFIAQGNLFLHRGRKSSISDLVRKADRAVVQCDGKLDHQVFDARERFRQGCESVSPCSN